MSIAYRDGAVGILAAIGGDLAVTIPSTVVGGDGMILAVDVAADVDPGAGWALRKKITTQDGNNKAYVYSRVAGPDDAGTTVTLLTAAVPSRGIATLVVWSGTDPGDPIHQIASTSDTATSTTHTTPGTITTTIAGCWEVEIVCSKSPNGNPITTWTPPGGFAARKTGLSGATSGQSQREAVIGDSGAAKSSGTTIGGHVWTADVASNNTALFTLALAPATGTQTVHPISDITTAGWTASPALASGQPQASNLSDGRDSSYLETGTGPTALVGEWALGRVVPPGAGEDMTLTVRCRDTSAASVTRVIELRQGATLISTHSDTTVRSSLTDVPVTVPAADLAAITDWSDLRVRVTQTTA
ncbi:hypothetical protein [Actinomadura sp. GTD37]|uniref:hypothetical protein n=1 Tax=Actinomadura sp. GTD37 TaxID=1778030 RepID=UPI0035BFEA0D